MKIWTVISRVCFILFNFLSLAGVLIKQVDGCTDMVKIKVHF